MLATNQRSFWAVPDDHEKVVPAQKESYCEMFCKIENVSAGVSVLPCLADLKAYAKCFVVHRFAQAVGWKGAALLFVRRLANLRQNSIL